MTYPTAAEIRQQMPTADDFLTQITDEIIVSAKQGYGSLIINGVTEDDPLITDHFVFDTVGAYNEECVAWEVCQRLVELGYVIQTDPEFIVISWDDDGANDDVDS